MYFIAAIRTCARSNLAVILGRFPVKTGTVKIGTVKTGNRTPEDDRTVLYKLKSLEKLTITLTLLGHTFVFSDIGIPRKNLNNL